ncbi:MAG: hypothetical protein ACR2MG_13540 [Pyrinomonadaceae bacterium]
MNQTDLLIIYLACGAPFGVYYFLQNRRRKNTSLFWLETIFTFVVWLPFAVRLFRKKVTFNRSQSLLINKEKNLYSIQKQIEIILLETNLQISIYNFREIFERYIGLTLANSGENKNIIEAEKEIFRVSKNSNIELAAICYHRRNRKRLSFHHTLARQDFLNIIAKLAEFTSAQNRLGSLAIEFVITLKDTEARKTLEIMFAETSQTDKQFAVKNLEKDLWKPERHKPLPINPISTQLQTMNATTRLRKID